MKIRRTHLLLSAALSLVFASSCADSNSGSGSRLCGSLTCPTGTICIAEICRDPNAPGGDEQDADLQDMEDTAATPDATSDADAPLPDDADDGVADADAPQDADIAPDATEEPCENCLIVADPEGISLTASSVGQVIERSITLWNVGERSARVRAVFLNHPNMSLVNSPEGAQLEALTGRTEFTLRYTANDLGPVNAEIRVLIDLPQTLVIPVQVVSKDNTSPCIEVTPTRVNFGRVQRGITATRPVTVSNCGGSDLNVTRIERGQFFGQPTPPSFQWTMSPGEPTTLSPGAQATIEVTYTPGRQGLDLGFFNIHSNDTTEPQVRVDLSGSATPPPIEEQDVHIQLDWDSNNCDVDLHFLAEQDDVFSCQRDCFYANPAPDWGTQGDWVDDPFLDYDNVQGFGPENINLQTMRPGRYLIALHFYDDTYEDSFSTDTNATVRVYFGGVLAGTFGPQRLDHTGRMWDVALLEWPSRRLTPLNNLYEVPFRGCR